MMMAALHKSCRYAYVVTVEVDFHEIYGIRCITCLGSAWLILFIYRTITNNIIMKYILELETKKKNTFLNGNRIRQCRLLVRLAVCF